MLNYAIFLWGWKIFRSGIIIKEIEFFRCGFFLRNFIFQISGFHPEEYGFFRYGDFYPGTWDTYVSLKWSWIFITGHVNFLKSEDFYLEDWVVFRFMVFLSRNRRFFKTMGFLSRKWMIFQIWEFLSRALGIFLIWFYPANRASSDRN